MKSVKHTETAIGEIKWEFGKTPEWYKSCDHYILNSCDLAEKHKNVKKHKNSKVDKPTCPDKRLWDKDETQERHI